MAVTYPLSLPTAGGIAAITFTVRDAVAVSRSPFSYAQQVFSHGGQQWEADITVTPMSRVDAAEWVAFLTKLRGQFGTFLLGDPANATAQGSAATTPGIPLVAGGSQTGSSLNIDGLPLSATDYLKAGDHIQLGSTTSSRVYMVLNDVTSDGTGAATVDIWPSITTAPVDNAVVTVAGAEGLFRLSDNARSWQVSEALRYGITFGAVSVP